MVVTSAPDWYAVQHGKARDHTPGWLEREPRAQRRVRVDRRATLPTLRHLRSHAERTVDEKSSRLQSVKFGAEVVATKQHRHPIASQILLQPQLIELQAV